MNPDHPHLRPVPPATAAGEALAVDRSAADALERDHRAARPPRRAALPDRRHRRARARRRASASRRRSSPPGPAGGTPEDVLVQAGALSQDALARAIAERNGLDHLDLTVLHVDMGAANLISSAAAKRYEAVPVQFIGDRALLVAMADPANVLAVDDIALMTGYEVRPAVASREDIARARSRA